MSMNRSETASRPSQSFLDARLVVWQHSIQSDGCTLSVIRSQELYGPCATASATCANVDLHLRVNGDDLHAASIKLGEFLRLLHAATARPVRCPIYDWLQQLLWPSVCTLPQCRCCHDGDRRMTLKLSCTTSWSVPLPQVISGSLFDWSDDHTSAEYKELISAIQQDAGGAAPEAPLKLVVEVQSSLSRLTKTTDYYPTSARPLLHHLSESTSDWFKVDVVSASFVHRGSFPLETLEMLATSKLPLALHEVSHNPRVSSIIEWLFGDHRRSEDALPLPIPVIVDLQMHSVAAPSARVFTEFCAWLATNDSLKVLVIKFSTPLVVSSPEAWEDFGFALFSPFSKLKLRHLELEVQGITDSDIDVMVSDNQRPCRDSQQRAHLSIRQSLHGKLSLKSAGLSTGMLIKFIRHLGPTVRGLDVRVDGRTFLLVLQAIMESSPELKRLLVTTEPLHANDLTANERAVVALTVPTIPILKLRSLTVVDMCDSVSPQAILRTVELVGQTLSYLCVKDHTATDALADTILDSCPMLQTLAVDKAEASFWQRLSEGYSSGACEISNLSIGEVACVPSPWVFDLLQTLTNPASPFTRALKKLKLEGRSYNWPALATLQHTLLEMLDKNRTLVQVVIPFGSRQRERVLVKHGEIVAHAAYPLHPRQRFALLSCSPWVANGKVPREIWRLILDFSARPARRRVVITRR